MTFRQKQLTEATDRSNSAHLFGVHSRNSAHSSYPALRARVQEEHLASKRTHIYTHTHTHTHTLTQEQKKCIVREHILPCI